MTFDADIMRRLPVELCVQISENAFRKEWTPSELDRARRQIETHIAGLAREHQRDGGRLKGGGKLPQDARFKTRDVMAELLGTSGRTLDKIRQVVDSADERPEKWGRFRDEMDAEGSVDGAYQRLLEAQRADQIGDDVPPEPGDPIVRHGEIWLLGDHRLMCGDSTVPDDVRRLLAGATPHLMVTDAPYGVNFAPAWRAKVLGRRRIPRGVMNDDRADWSEAYALFPGDVAYVYHGSLKSDDVIVGLENLGLERRGYIVSVKPQFVIGRGHYHSQYEGCWYVVRRGRDAHWQGGRDKSDVWTIIRSLDGRDDRTIHGTQKPVECMLQPIENSSQPGDAVYDPFVGSGTTIIAAEIAGRRCYAMDLDPVYCTVAVERWQNFTKRKAVLEANGRVFDDVKTERLRSKEASTCESNEGSQVHQFVDGGEGVAGGEV